MTQLPDELDTAKAKLVYFYLETTGGATVEELRDALNIPLITLIPTVNVLHERSLVTVQNDRYIPAKSTKTHRSVGAFTS